MNPILIGGTGRSGTTVLKRLLLQHARITGLPDELRLLVDPDGALDLVRAFTTGWSPYAADKALHRFRAMVLAGARSRTELGIRFEKVEKRLFRAVGLTPRAYLGLGLGCHFDRAQLLAALDRLTDELTHHVSRGSWAGSVRPGRSGRLFETGPVSAARLASHVRDFVTALYTSRHNRARADRWVDDTPTNLLHVDGLLGIFPALRFLHIYRDPRDVLASHLRFSWGGDDAAAVARRLAAMYERWFALRAALPDECYREISLEELARAADAVMLPIWSWLELEPCAGAELSLGRVHAGRWRDELDRSATAQTFAPLIEAIEHYGYGSS